MNAEPNDARGSAMPLLCSLGRHVPRRLPIWNEGYYFSVCRRCNRDIVQALNGRWQVPCGYRVVWQPGRPESEQVPTLTGEASPVPGVRANDAPSAAAVTNVDQPSEQDNDVSDDAFGISDPGSNPRQDDQLDEPATQTQPPDAPGMPEAHAPRPLRSSIPDFMDDRAMSSPPPGENKSRDGASTLPPLARGARDELDRIGLANLAAMSNRVFSRVRTPAAVVGNRTSAGNLNFTAWVVAAVLLVIVVTQNLNWQSKKETAASIQPPVVAQSAPARNASAVPQRTPGDVDAPATVANGAMTPGAESESPIADGQNGVQTRPPAEAAKVRSATANKIVLASILNCRAGPALTSPPTMRMLRGAVVTTSAKQGEWAYVTHHGRSCWAQSSMLQR